MTNEQMTELLAVGRRALAQALRQWKMYADDRTWRDEAGALGTTKDTECKFYNEGLATLKRLGAAADELADASLARKTAFDSSAWVGQVEAAYALAIEAREKAHRSGPIEDYYKACEWEKRLTECANAVRRPWPTS